MCVYYFNIHLFLQFQMESAVTYQSTPLSSRTPPSHDKRGEGAKKKLFNRADLQPCTLVYDSTVQLSSSINDSTIELSSATSMSSSPSSFPFGQHVQQTLDKFFPKGESTPLPPPPSTDLPSTDLLPPEVEAILQLNPSINYQIVVTKTTYTLSPM